MSKRVLDVLVGIFGLCMILLNRHAARNTVTFWNRVQRNMYDEEDFKLFRVAFVVGGCAFVAFALRDLW